jgi:hypothetical protein
LIERNKRHGISKAKKRLRINKEKVKELETEEL